MKIKSLDFVILIEFSEAEQFYGGEKSLVFGKEVVCTEPDGSISSSGRIFSSDKWTSGFNPSGVNQAIKDDRKACEGKTKTSVLIAGRKGNGI